MTNSYHLGVDVGASRVHAATARYTSSRNERVEPCVLSTTGDDMSASMWVSREGDLEFGAIASAWAREQPEAIVGDLRRRIGTGIPFLVAGHRVFAEEAYAQLVAWVVGAVTEIEGVPPVLSLIHIFPVGSPRRSRSARSSSKADRRVWSWGTTSSPGPDWATGCARGPSPSTGR